MVEKTKYPKQAFKYCEDLYTVALKYLQDIPLNKMYIGFSSDLENDGNKPAIRKTYGITDEYKITLNMMVLNVLLKQFVGLSVFFAVRESKMTGNDLNKLQEQYGKLGWVFNTMNFDSTKDCQNFRIVVGFVGNFEYVNTLTDLKTYLKDPLKIPGERFMVKMYFQGNFLGNITQLLPPNPDADITQARIAYIKKLLLEGQLFADLNSPPDFNPESKTFMEELWNQYGKHRTSTLSMWDIIVRITKMKPGFLSQRYVSGRTT